MTDNKYNEGKGWFGKLFDKVIDWHVRRLYAAQEFHNLKRNAHNMSTQDVSSEIKRIEKLF